MGWHRAELVCSYGEMLERLGLATTTHYMRTWSCAPGYDALGHNSVHLFA